MPYVDIIFLFFLKTNISLMSLKKHARNINFRVKMLRSKNKTMGVVPHTFSCNPNVKQIWCLTLF